jgi:hypothetical protein
MENFLVNNLEVKMDMTSSCSKKQNVQNNKYLR